MIGANNIQIFEQKKLKKKDLNREVSRLGVDRYKVDAADLIEAIRNAEDAFYPRRVKMQQVLRECAMNAHVKACWERRKGNVMLKKHVYIDKSGKANEEWTEFFNSKFIYDIKSHALDAIIYGYSLINWTEIKDDKILGVKVIKRENVLPDIKHLIEHTHAYEGVSFDDKRYRDWILYVDTPSEFGISNCGYGILLEIAINEIYLRNTIGLNAEYLEKFGMPYIMGDSTGLKEGDELDRFQERVKDFAGGKYGISDNMNEIKILQNDTDGGTNEVWRDFYELNLKYISKRILGHGSALDSTTGKLGAQDEVQQAIDDKAKEDVIFIENTFNDNLIPKLRNLGFNIPEGKLLHDNDKEKQEEKANNVKYLKDVADMVNSFKNSGKAIDPKWLKDNTGIDFVEIVEDDKQVKKPMPKSKKAPAKKKVKDTDGDASK